MRNLLLRYTGLVISYDARARAYTFLAFLSETDVPDAPEAFVRVLNSWNLPQTVQGMQRQCFAISTYSSPNINRHDESWRTVLLIS